MNFVLTYNDFKVIIFALLKILQIFEDRKKPATNCAEMYSLVSALIIILCLGWGDLYLTQISKTVGGAVNLGGSFIFGESFIFGKGFKLKMVCVCGGVSKYKRMRVEV